VTMDARRSAALAVPVAVPLSMAAVFGVLRRVMGPRKAWTTGFAAYWICWCGAFPLWVLGPRGIVGLLTSGRRPRPAEIPLVVLPVLGAIGAELWPNRRQVSPAVALVAAGIAAVNAVGEELLWRGVFLTQFRGDVVRGALWPLAGFTAWHLAPQVVRPSPRGRTPFVLGSAVVGASATVTAWRTGGLRSVVLPHALTDACGVRAARFWLGR
jgi:membrane protease YdiL (CAAX protease family)